jgi:acetoin utilization deacetylase AcuC-like enzyme
MALRIVFHKRYLNSRYASDPAAYEGRLDGIMSIVQENPDIYSIITPEPAVEAEILAVHGKAHYEEIRSDPLLFEMASLAAGGAIAAARGAFEGNPSFAVIRPPGHHASADSCWGFCYFNNMSVSLLSLYREKKIRHAFVLDFDLHTGDGNLNILERRGDGLLVTILNPMSGERNEYIREVDRFMSGLENVDIFAASAGFDQGIDDWGGLLYPEDYTELGRLMKEHSERLCGGRRYALLEGGYNHDAIGNNFDSFCRGFM